MLSLIVGLLYSHTMLRPTQHATIWPAYEFKDIITVLALGRWKQVCWGENYELQHAQRHRTTI